MRPPGLPLPTGRGILRFTRGREPYRAVEALGRQDVRLLRGQLHDLDEVR
ncbi:hypothetical protein ABH927_001599 [Planotetraspora sp. GP83]